MLIKVCKRNAFRSSSSQQLQMVCRECRTPQSTHWECSTFDREAASRTWSWLLPYRNVFQWPWPLCRGNCVHLDMDFLVCVVSSQQAAPQSSTLWQARIGLHQTMVRLHYWIHMLPQSVLSGSLSLSSDSSATRNTIS